MKKIQVRRSTSLLLVLAMLLACVPYMAGITHAAASKLSVIAVTASGHDGNFPDNTLDDNLETRWSAQGSGQWIAYQLDSAQEVGYLGIAFVKGDQRQTTVSIEASQDGTNWTEVLGQTISSGATIGLEAFDMADTTASYIRITGYGNTSNDWNSISVVHLYAPQPDGSTPLQELQPPPAEEREDVTYTQPGMVNPDGSAHVIHTPNAVTGETLNVEAYGADPQDNGQDDLPAILAALEAAEAGDEVYLPNGTYNLNSTLATDGTSHIALKSGVNLRGESRENVKLVSSLAAQQNGKVMNAFGKHDIRISDLTITFNFTGSYSTDHTINNPSAAGPDYGIYIADGIGRVPSYNMTIDNVIVENFRKMGVRIENSRDIVVTNSLFRNATDVGGGGAGYGVSIQGTVKTDRSGYANDTIYNVVQNSEFIGPHIRHGVLLQYYAHNNLVTGNTLTGTVLDAIDLHGEDEYLNMIEQNTISDIPKGAAIALGNTGGTAPSNHDNSGPGNVIANNTITNAREGIKVHMGSPDTVIENNTIQNTVSPDGAKGILLMNAPGTIVRSNLITGNTASGFWGISLEQDPGDSNAAQAGAGEPDDILITGNTITNNTGGIRIHAGTNINVDDTNVVADNTFANMQDTRSQEPTPTDPPGGGEEGGVDGETIELTAIADSFIRDGIYANDNYGDATKLKVKERAAGNDFRRQAIMKFDLSDLEGDVRRATLKFYNVNLETATGTAGGYQIQAIGIEDGWEEGTVTFANAPTGSAVSSPVKVEGDAQYVELNVSEFVKNQQDAYVSFRVAGVEDNLGSDFASKENDLTKPPVLEIVLEGQEEQPEEPKVPEEPEQPDSLIVEVSEDTYIQGGTSEDDNYGGSPTLKLKRTSSENRDMFLKFNMPSIDGVVEEAVLQLFVKGIEGSTLTKPEKGYWIDVRGINDDSWTEMGITYTNAPAEEGAELARVFVGEAEIGTYVSLDVTSFVKAHKDATITLRLRGIDSSRGAEYASKEDTTTDKPAQLILQIGEKQVLTEAPQLTAESGHERVELNWTEVTGALGYTVKRASSPDGPYETVKNQTTELSYVDETVVNDLTYYYKVAAFNEAGAGPDSEAATGAPRFPLQVSITGMKDMKGQAIAQLDDTRFAVIEAAAVNASGESTEARIVFQLLDASGTSVAKVSTVKRLASQEQTILKAGFQLPANAAGYEIDVQIELVEEGEIR
ncbi:CBM96 family carbohydrate-binding protein [Paenibacillus soyae]|uniref:DNRLRE domain-containing protein n=1 Tax=Paenibacillus soyae TaxID=2969249 RepID=A0A9X2S754_9BACL|nr:DNRLRE domain-containing protein [Paenibacillus soyae]MCR2802686.1 DNRLRE domain-containing protein [Paenibacillus soyae]